MLVGFVDFVDRHGISGWAADARRPNGVVELLVYVNGTLAGRVMADQTREDIKALGIYGEGRHGFHFNFDFPLSLLRRYDIIVSFAATKAHVEGGRITLDKQTLADFERPDPASASPTTDDLSPVMITSTGRSGTTMLMRRLGNDGAVVIGEQFPFEVKLITYYAQAFEILTSPGNREKSVTPELIADDPYHLGSNPYYHHYFQEVFPKHRMLNEFFSKRVPPIVAMALKQIITAFYGKMMLMQRKPNARYFAEKCDVFNTARDFARLLYPGMREIILLRDPRDIFCSQRAFWSADPAEAFQALRSVRDRMLEFHAEQAQNLLFVKYEDLVVSPRETMARISSLLGLPDAIEINSQIEEQQFKQHGTSSDAGASIGRWRHELDQDQLRHFDQELGVYFDTFGYERSAPPQVVSVPGLTGESATSEPAEASPPAEQEPEEMPESQPPKTQTDVT